MRDNIKYMLSNWLKWDRKSLVYFLIRIPALVFQPIVTSYIPKAMIDCINEGATVGRLTLVVGLLSVLVVLTTWLSPFMQELLNGSARIIRMRYAVLAFNKNLNTDYTNIESQSGREKNKRAMEFYRSYYSGSSDFLDSCNQFCVCVVGVAASLALIYKINIIMILIIFATCAAEFFLLGFLNGKEKKTKNERSKIFVRYDYYYNLCRDFSAAKDIRLYGFTDYFLFAIAKIICDLEKINQKFMRQNIRIGGLRALLNLIRELVAYAYLSYLVCGGRLSVSDFIFYFGIITGFSCLGAGLILLSIGYGYVGILVVDFVNHVFANKYVHFIIFGINLARNYVLAVIILAERNDYGVLYLLIEILGRNSFFFFKHLHSFKKFLIHFNNHSFQGSAVFFRHGDYCLLHIKVVKLYKRSFLLFKGHSAALIEFNRDKTCVVIL